MGFEKGMKGYKISIPQFKQIVISRDVKFFKRIFPYSEENDINREDSIAHEEQEENVTDQQNNLDRNTDKSNRKHRQPSYLQDYYYSLSKGVNTETLGEGKLYPLSNVLSYNKPSKTHMAFSISLLKLSQSHTKLQNKAKNGLKLWRQS